MNRLTRLRHEFVEFIPKDVDEGVLYISIPYNTAVHKCACGCGGKITTPISPVRWRLTYDGEGVSLHPSVGNWSYPCQSHYWIKRNRIDWAPKWSREKIEAARSRDRADKERSSYGSRGVPARSQAIADPPRVGFTDRLRHLFRR